MRPALGAGIVVAVVVHVGTGAVADGLRAVSGGALVAALGIGFLTTAAAAARWVVVARGVGLRLGFRGALAGCYRSQFLNSVLPAGVLGDVHRAYDHGRRSGDVARGVRAVVIERVAGQVVVVLICGAILLGSPGPARGLLDPVTALWAVAVVGAAALGLAQVPRVRTVLSALVVDARAGLAGRGGPAVVGLSVLATAGHLALLVVAAGPVAPLGELLPLLALPLLAMGLPVNVGGWGPREATTTVAFSAAGLGASAGLATAVTYGVLAFVSCLPGLVVLARASVPAVGADERPGRGHGALHQPQVVGTAGRRVPWCPPRWGLRTRVEQPGRPSTPFCGIFPDDEVDWLRQHLILPPWCYRPGRRP